MNISLSDDLKAFVDREVGAGAYTSASEFVRQLIREKREEVVFRQKILEGVSSPTVEQGRDEFFAELYRRARGEQ